MNPLSTSAFDLHNHPAKADPALITTDDEHFAAIAATLEENIADLTDRLDAARRTHTRLGQEALERDQQVHRLSARLRTLRRFGLDLCLGRIVSAGPTDPADPTDPTDTEPVYIGRLGLTDSTGRRLLVDWRSPAAAPFFAATHGDPMGLASRRRYRWTRGRITDYWDEVFTADVLDGHTTLATHATLDDQSAFIASLGTNRSPRMRDVLGTIQADQDAIIRASSRGALVVDGGPGTGKTVVALHRAAYLLYSDPRLGHRRGGVLFVGPHQPYLAYVSDVLPSLGEEGVQTCTIRDLLPEGAEAQPEPDPEAAALKQSARWAEAVDAAVRFYEDAPTTGMEVDAGGASLWLSADDWTTAFAAPAPGTPHNEARDQVLDEIVTILADKHAEDTPEDEQSDTEVVKNALRHHRDLLSALNTAWPLIEPTDLVRDLWSVPAYLRLAAPWLTPEERTTLRRNETHPWTTEDLPILDLARRRLGDPEASRRRREQEATLAAQRAQMQDVIDDAITHDDSEMLVMSMLRGTDLKSALVDDSAVDTTDPDLLAGPFAHIIVDEAQELTDAEWQMLLARCPSRSFTIVGDRAQARHGFTESWSDRLSRNGIDNQTLTSLTINYRTPEEVMTAAEPVIRAAIPDANVPTSIRQSGIPVRHGSTSDLHGIVDEWLATHPEGVACVVGDPTYPATERVQSLAPELTKGLEFDLVVLVDPDRFGTGIEGAVDRYVAMTRATSQLVLLTSPNP